MIGYQLNKSALDKVQDLLEELDLQWLSQLRDEVNQFDSWDNENGTFYVPVAEWNSDDDTYSPGTILYRFIWYCWHGIPGSVHPIKPVESITPKAKDILSKINTFLHTALHHSKKSPESQAALIETIIDNLKKTCQIKTSEADNQVFKTAFDFIAYRGEIFIRNEFIEYTSYWEPTLVEQPLKFNLNQDHLAYLLVVLLKGGAIENTKEEVAAFAEKHFLVNKGQGKARPLVYSPLLYFKNKIKNFFNGKDRFADAAEKNIEKIIEKGIAAVKA